MVTSDVSGQARSAFTRLTSCWSYPVIKWCGMIWLQAWEEFRGWAYESQERNCPLSYIPCILYYAAIYMDIGFYSNQKCNGNQECMWSSYLSEHVTCIRLVGLSPNTPLQTDARPISWACFLCFACGSTFVNTSAVCSGSWQLSNWISLFCTRSCTRCHLIAICLACLWNVGLFAIVMDPSLSL